MGVKIIVDLPKSEYEYLAKLALKGDEQIGHYERVLIGGKPLKQGYWKMRHYIDKNRQGFNMWWCSECYEEYSYDAETGVGITDAHYCPNCGAEMSKENKNADSH